MEVVRWETPLSDLELDFEGIHHVWKEQNEVVFKVTGCGIGFSRMFDVVLGTPHMEPYFIIDEEWLLEYWDAKPKGAGNTLIIRYSNFAPLIDGHIEASDKFEHYLVATSSLCLGVYAAKPPIIRKVAD